MSQETRVQYDGWLFAYALTRDHLSLRLFRWITLARVPLSSIVYIRRRALADWAALWAHPFRYWYWPHPLNGYRRFRSHAYVAKCRNGTRLYLRLKTGFHYQLRVSAGQRGAARG